MKSYHSTLLHNILARIEGFFEFMMITIRFVRRHRHMSERAVNQLELEIQKAYRNIASRLKFNLPTLVKLTLMDLRVDGIFVPAAQESYYLQNLMQDLRCKFFVIKSCLRGRMSTKRAFIFQQIRFFFLFLIIKSVAYGPTVTPNAYKINSSVKG